MRDSDLVHNPILVLPGARHLILEFTLAIITAYLFSSIVGWIQSGTPSSCHSVLDGSSRKPTAYGGPTAGSVQ
ncbi:MAG: hypothetical protein ACI9YT_002295 [Halobacteriales archaeon]|jgi:hypothetical protein